MNYCYYTTFQPVQTKRGVTQVFKNIPNHSLCDLHTILNEHTHQYNKHPGTFKVQKIIFVYFCLFLSVDFVNILPKSGGEQTLIELEPPPPPIYINLISNSYNEQNIKFVYSGKIPVPNQIT